MIADLKPYAEYKESGLPWLGQVPGHWTVETLRRLLRSGDGIKIGPFGSQLKLAHMSESGFKVYGQANVIAGDIRRGSKFVDEAKFEQLRECEVRPGDLLVTMMGTSGRCMVVPGDAAAGLMDSHLLRLRLRANGVGPVFTSLAIDQGPYVKRQVEVAGKGSIMHGLNSGMVKNLALVIPPPAEQAAIVRFLDWANGRLERAIRAKRKVIALLNEQKQAIIHRAVTRGLDPSVPLKPSGIPWLGDIPRHWEVRPLKALSPRISGRLVYQPAQYFTENGVPFLMGNNVTPDGIKWANVRRIPESVNDRFAQHALREGDVITVRVGAPGMTCEVPREADGLNCGSLMIIRRSPGFYSRWLAHTMNSSVIRHQIALVQYGAAQEQINIKDAVNFLVPVPSREEQEEIARKIEVDLAPIVAAKDRVDRELGLLREYRTRLVADVVTGKLDVRETAARLPDDAAPDIAEDDTDPSIDPEAADEEPVA